MSDGLIPAQGAERPRLCQRAGGEPGANRALLVCTIASRRNSPAYQNARLAATPPLQKHQSPRIQNDEAEQEVPEGLNSRD